MLKTLVESQGGQFDEVEKVPPAIPTQLRRLKMACLMQRGFIMAGTVCFETQGMDTNFALHEGLCKEFDYYSPVIVLIMTS